MSDTIKLTTAGNVVVPAFLTLQQRGYSVRRDAPSGLGNEPLWHAEREGIHLVAEEPLNLLALAAIVESRGAEWRATDEQSSHSCASTSATHPPPNHAFQPCLSGLCL